MTVLKNGVLASGSYDNNIILWNPTTWEKISILRGHTEYVRALTILPGEILVSCASDKTIKFWCTSKYELLNTIPNAHSTTISCLCALPYGI